jgi:hypothetical protein
MLTYMMVIDIIKLDEKYTDDSIKNCENLKYLMQN